MAAILRNSCLSCKTAGAHGMLWLVNCDSSGCFRVYISSHDRLFSVCVSALNPDSRENYWQKHFVTFSWTFLLLNIANFELFRDCGILYSIILFIKVVIKTVFLTYLIIWIVSYGGITVAGATSRDCLAETSRDVVLATVTPRYLRVSYIIAVLLQFHYLFL
jgi:hypothetical protein